MKRAKNRMQCVYWQLTASIKRYFFFSFCFFPLGLTYFISAIVDGLAQLLVFLDWSVETSFILNSRQESFFRFCRKASWLNFNRKKISTDDQSRKSKKLKRTKPKASASDDRNQETIIIMTIISFSNVKQISLWFIKVSSTHIVYT